MFNVSVTKVHNSGMYYGVKKLSRTNLVVHRMIVLYEIAIFTL